MVQKYYVLGLEDSTLYGIYKSLKEAKASLPDPILSRGEAACRDIFVGNVVPKVDYELSASEIRELEYVNSYRATNKTVKVYKY